MSRPMIFAHRGASGIRFENTMAAFRKAYEQKADGIELDIQLTEDGVPMVIHDPDLYRLTGIRRSITTMTSAELAELRVGRKYSRLFFGHRIPTLIEVVSFCLTHDLGLNVELKETVSERPESIMQIVSLASTIKDVHISSFDYHLLEKVKEADSGMETAYLLRKKSIDWNRLERYSCADGFHLHKRLLKEPYLSKLIQTRKKIRVYGMTGKEPVTANPPAFINGWITDYPNHFHTKKDQGI
ncbi:glycerophosphodiester phosphodiesterase [Sporosarcina limicola]|uniref:Glycerophosphoryl diester phosphodiesterase n=1 Tax=Sporosarcina limicola TaxID=34101 RepID=A0A927R5D4_9BACL|nr:glycerophosphodiester phosphodiesterase family protein [Sporosarcina limicola]MBE1553799.1 glycerophosphoryl diester phosphodiesterase [Sporosarcina limicola]